MKRVWLAILVMMGLVMCQFASAEIYRWVDKNGKVQYSDVPPTDTTAQTRKLHDNTIETDKLPYEVRQAMAAAPITFYSSADYKDVSDSARALLRSRKLPFTEKVVKTTDDLKDAIKQFNKAPTVPALVVGNKLVEGFNEGSWNSALDAAGYPKVLKPKTADQ